MDQDDADRVDAEIEAIANRHLREIRREKLDLGTCNYFTGKHDRICSATGGLCAVLGEPLCQTDRPAEGWPSEETPDGP